MKRASSRGNPYHDELGRFATSDAAKISSEKSKEEYVERNLERLQANRGNGNPEDSRCPNCGYKLIGGVCPNCGRNESVVRKLKDLIENNKGEIIAVGKYKHYRMTDGSVNPEFDSFSGKILDLKDKKQQGVDYFFANLDEALPSDVSICVIPSHKASSSNESGIAMLARKLAINGRNDCVNGIIRTRTIKKKAHGGERSLETERSSIALSESVDIKGKTVILLDDVSTTGTSMRAGAELLKRHGAYQVIKIVLGKAE